jgi:hypothetical protein
MLIILLQIRTSQDLWSENDYYNSLVWDNLVFCQNLFDEETCISKASDAKDAPKEPTNKISI